VGVFDEFSLPTNSFFVDVCQIEIDLSEDFKDNFQTVKKSVGEKIKVNPKGKLVGNSNKKVSGSHLISSHQSVELEDTII